MKKLLCTLAILAASAAPAQMVVQPEAKSSISVQGEAVVYAVPNRILLSFGIETFDKDLTVAKAKNTAIQKKAIEGMKEAGLKEKDVNTDALTMEPVYRYDGDHRKYLPESFLGYAVVSNFTVIISDPAKVDATVTKALEAGVNCIRGVDFQTTDFKKFREEAREAAMKAAREKAQKMAGAIGQDIGKARSITEQDASSFYYGYWQPGGRSGSSRNFQMSQNAFIDRGGDDNNAQVDSVALGKITIRAKAYIVFELK
jgi:uncharacterized protein YggE